MLSQLRSIQRIAGIMLGLVGDKCCDILITLVRRQQSDFPLIHSDILGQADPLSRRSVRISSILETSLFASTL